jgi:haloalkane dehalogenase
VIKFEEIQSEYPFKSNFMKVKSYNYHYIDEGNGDETLLMVHGNPSWSFLYRKLILEFRKNYRVIAPDHLGCGLSDKPQDFPYRLETHIDNLETFFLSLNLDKITLVMHDWGAIIGMGLAVRHPEKIARLVILNSTAFSTPWIPIRLMPLRVPWLGDKLVRSMNLYLRSSIHMSARKTLPSIVRKGFLFPYQTYNDRIAILRFVQDIPVDPEHVSFEVLLEIEHGLWMFREMPVCILWGMKDWCFSRHHLNRWCLYYPQAKVCKLENSGHYLLEDEGEKAIDFMRKFLNNTDTDTII